MKSRARRLCLTTILSMTCIGAAHAQDSRTAVIENLQAEKAQVAEPYKAGRVERVLGYVDRNDLVERFTQGDGFFPTIGGITTGGGLAFGGGYRQHMLDRRAVVEVSGATSLKGYRHGSVQVVFPELFRGRLEVGGEVTYRFFPQEDFYGVGFSSLEDDRVNFLIKGFDYSGTAVFHPRSWFSAGTKVGYLTTDIGQGTDSRFPSIEQRFTASTVPGLEAAPDFVYGELFADVDTRDEPGNPRSGAHYRATWARYRDRDLRQFSFARFSAEASQFFPVFDKKRVFLVRGLLTLSDPDAQNAVPFFMMPAFGGSHTLRSVDDFRFRDSHRLLFNVEYRWEAFSGMDMALFIDAGKVASRRRDIDLTDLKKAYGIGFRFNTSRGIFYRIDIAHGEEGFRFFFKFSGPFKNREHWPADSRSHRHKRPR